MYCVSVHAYLRNFSNYNCIYVLFQYGDDEQFSEGFDESSMKVPGSLYTNTHIQDSYDLQDDSSIHPSIAGFPSHNRKVQLRANQISLLEKKHYENEVFLKEQNLS